MDGHKIFNAITVVICITMFLVQFKTAVEKLKNPLITEFTKHLDIDEIDPPLISICPLGQYNQKQLENLGYSASTSLFLGLVRDENYLSWGAHMNKSFEEILELVLVDQEQTMDPIEVRGGKTEQLDDAPKFGRNFYPRYGYCWELARYSAKNLSEQLISLPAGQYHVYLTDRKLTTHTTLDLSTHKENSIQILEPGWYSYDVSVRIASRYDPRFEDSCHDYVTDGELALCVDEEIKQSYHPILGCNPPWVSTDEECKSTIKKTSQVEAALDESWKFQTVLPIMLMDRQPGQKACTKSCNTTISRVKFKEHVEDIFFTYLKLIFADEADYRVKELAYGKYEFLIDIGSSLGLWLGLSVFGLSSMVVELLLIARKVAKMAKLSTN